MQKEELGMINKMTFKWKKPQLIINKEKKKIAKLKKEQSHSQEDDSNYNKRENQDNEEFTNIALNSMSKKDLKTLVKNNKIDDEIHIKTEANIDGVGDVEIDTSCPAIIIDDELIINQRKCKTNVKLKKSKKDDVIEESVEVEDTVPDKIELLDSE